MRRVALIALTYLVGGAALGALVVLQWGDGAEAAGRALYPHRSVLARLALAKDDPPPAVVWLGDSTMLGDAYPDVLARTKLPAADQSLKVASWGLDCWAFYQLLGPVMARRPRVVVLVANMRLLRMPSGTRGFNDLAALIPLDELPRTLALPFSFRGMTMPRLLLARAMAAPVGERVFFAAEGLRRQFQTAPFWSTLGPEERPRQSGDEATLRFFSGVGRIMDAYDAPIGRNSPLVRFCRAGVRFARARGAQVLVVVTPMPVRALTDAGRYDPARIDRRIAMLRREVESAGGQLLDLHDAVPTAQLTPDLTGHFTPEGHRHMAALVWPQVGLSLMAAPSAPPAAR